MPALPAWFRLAGAPHQPGTICKECFLPLLDWMPTFCGNRRGPNGELIEQGDPWRQYPGHRPKPSFDGVNQIAILTVI